jgi:hypothetical protein
MNQRKSRTKAPQTIDGTTLLPVPTPPINLHDLEAVRREMARVYRDMRGHQIDTQDGTRLIYALSQIGKLHEAVELEQRITLLEGITP